MLIGVLFLLLGVAGAIWRLSAARTSARATVNRQPGQLLGELESPPDPGLELIGDERPTTWGPR